VLPYAEGFEQATGKLPDKLPDRLPIKLTSCYSLRSSPFNEEMMQHLGLSHRGIFRDTFLLPLIASGKLVPTIPDKPVQSQSTLHYRQARGQ